MQMKGCGCVPIKLMLNKKITGGHCFGLSSCTSPADQAKIHNAVTQAQVPYHQAETKLFTYQAQNSGLERAAKVPRQVSFKWHDNEVPLPYLYTQKR